jgi:hypothetical protein
VHTKDGDTIGAEYEDGEAIRIIGRKPQRVKTGGGRVVDEKKVTKLGADRGLVEKA